MTTLGASMVYWLALIWLGLIIYHFASFYQSTYARESKNSYFQTFFNRGNRGEYMIFKSLEHFRQSSAILTNVYLPKYDGTTSEIDIIFISRKGLFIIESKNYSGWIYGRENYKHWIQTFNNGTKHQFYNPIWQNRGHVKVVKDFTGLPWSAFQSVIIFSNDCKLKKVRYWSDEVNVIYNRKLKRYLKKQFRRREDILTDKEINDLYDRLKPYTGVTKRVKRRHRKYVKKTIKRSGKRFGFWHH